MTTKPSAGPRSRSLFLRWLLLASFLLVLVVAVVMAVFPWGLLKPLVEQRLSKATGREVRIEALQRADWISYHPTLLVRGLRISQAKWAGSGHLAIVEEARVRFSVLSLLGARFVPEAVQVRNARLNFVRDAAGRKNWEADTAEGKSGDGARPQIDRLEVSNVVVSYKDAKRDRSALVTLQANAQVGLRIAGTGIVKGTPVTIKGSGSPITGRGSDGAWPFDVQMDGEAVAMRMRGQMDRALDLGHLNADVTARGRDLAFLDAIIEAGLPATQPVKLTAKVRRDTPDWTITALSGTIGQSDISGKATIRKREGRTRIDGEIKSARFNFEDLSSDEGRRKAALKRARFGERVIPDTAIDLATVDKTDGRLELRADRLIWPGSTPFRSLKATLVLDRSLLTLEPVTLGLTRGQLTGLIRIDQRSGRPVLTTQLRLNKARLVDIFPDAAITGALVGSIRLTGTGKTIRAAIGQSQGIIALFAHDGIIPARTASLLGQDVGRGLTTDKEELATLRCMAARLEVSGGIARANPVVIDTSRAQTRATGTVNLRDERLALMLSGAPKRSSLLRLDGRVPIGGTIKAPDIRVPESARSVGGVLKMLGKSLTGEQGATAVDANCSALRSTVLR